MKKQNQLLAAMVRCIKKYDPYIEMDDIKIGAYVYCSNNYIGEHSDYYKLMCEIDLNYYCSDDELFKDFQNALCAYDILTCHFKTTHTYENK